MTLVKSTGLSPGLTVIPFSNFEQGTCPLSAEPSPLLPLFLPELGGSEVKKKKKKHNETSKPEPLMFCVCQPHFPELGHCVKEYDLSLREEPRAGVVSVVGIYHAAWVQSLFVFICGDLLRCSVSQVELEA